MQALDWKFSTHFNWMYYTWSTSDDLARIWVYVHYTVNCPLQRDGFSTAATEKLNALDNMQPTEKFALPDEPPLGFCCPY